ncbi:MAG: hypothetical protein MJY69_06245 [Bacteroidales bacterium]|nr:hypothetical protein [Bacteroidales bacterium]
MAMDEHQHIDRKICSLVLDGKVVIAKDICLRNIVVVDILHIVQGIMPFIVFAGLYL